MIDYASLDSAIGQDFYGLDPDLQGIVRRECPPEDLASTEAKLHEFGCLVGDVIAPNAEVIDRNPPRLVRWDRWGNEVDEIEHHPAALDSKRALWQVGYVSGFAQESSRTGREFPAVARAAAGYLLCEADTGLSCSLGMTGGVAGLVDAYAPPDIRERLLAGLRGADLDSGIDGSMFLTERDGGSDLGATVHCVARDIGDGRVLISGEKWFCSNIDGAAIVMLARPEGAPDGPAGLGLYLVPKQLEDGSRNSFTMRRLKDKLGTRSVPTGEVEFHDALGYALRPRSSDQPSHADVGGLARMMEMVNTSRLGVAFMGLGIARRAFLEAAIWAHHRRAKGRLLVDLPLVREQLVDLLADLEAATALGFECSTRAGRPDVAQLRRVLVPAAKARLTRLGVHAASVAIELYGGNGYCEDWGLTRQLRDAQCHPIWEGSENICALDVLRAIRREGAHDAAFARIDEALATAGRAEQLLTPAVAATRDARDALADRVAELLAGDGERAEASAGRLTRGLADVVSAALLLERAADDPHKALVATRFVRAHISGDRWDDRVASLAGRELLSYEAIDEAFAAKALAA